MIKAVIFDMDGVIIDSEPMYLTIQWEYARTKNPDVKYEELFPMVGATKKDAWSVMEKAIHNGQTWSELRAEFKSRVDMFTNTDYRTVFRPQVCCVLKTLKEKGYRLAVASSTQLDVVERVMRDNNIYGYFDVLVSGDQFTMSKPDPEIYHYTAEKLRVREDECLVVEDSPFGILAAHRAGMKIVALEDSRFHFDQKLANWHIKDVKDVTAIVSMLEKEKG
ncbi:HAD family phosphatase [Clostridium sp. AM58-1XD]|uniref:HAD family hydrolase n=1 Tax=Clostridium sp. AM58-1XD TaxID=2292307 RepID=UPI000E4D3E03|nr:HAD family phosphatase [Clostridium sp. AM58-1XD]RGY96478.1 HAD family phosphatase [Clostridium sp. AM58-1XD]